MGLAAIIGGTGIERLPESCEATRQTVETPNRRVDVFECHHEGTRFLFLPRHGTEHALAPHEIDNRANIAALAQLGVTHIIGTNAVGSLRQELTPGAIVVPDDFIDFARARPLTSLAPGSAVYHADMSEPYCPQLRSLLVSAAAHGGLHVATMGVYVSVDGPRFETPAEVRMFAQWGGDIVGMTGAIEAVFARETGICYASLAIVTNLGVGLSPVPVRHGDVTASMRASADSVTRILLRAVAQLPAERTCRCWRPG